MPSSVDLTMTSGDSPATLPSLRLAGRTVLVVDIVEFVRLMEQDEAGTVDRCERLFAAFRERVVPEHGGRVVKSTGDGLLADFDDAGAAVRAAFAMQRCAASFDVAVEADRRIALRVAAAHGDVWQTGHDIQGRAVNLAARLATLAAPGEIVASVEVRDRLMPGHDADPEDLGDCYLKHLAAPVRAYRLAPPGQGGTTAHPVATEPAVGGADPLRAGIAVLPLAPLESGQGLAAIGDLIGDEIRGGLARSAHLHVIARLSCNVAARRGLGLAEIGTMLGAAYVLSGTVWRRGDRVRARTELSRTADQSVVWSDAFEADLPQLLQADDGIVPGVVAAISDAILQQELIRSSTLPLPNLRSHSLLLAGLGLIHRSSRHDFERAQHLLEHLAQRHPRRPQPHALLGQWHAMRAVQGLSSDPQGDARRALDTANRALDVDASSALALTMKGLVHGFLLKDLDGAEASYRRALEVNPNEPLAWLYLGTLRGWRDEGATAWEAASRSLALSPVDPLRYYFDTLAGFAALVAGRLDDAERLARRSLRAHRLHTATHRTLAIAQWLRGDEDGARATMADMLRLEPGFRLQAYRVRFPGGEGPLLQRFAEVLREAGAPD